MNDSSLSRKRPLRLAVVLDHPAQHFAGGFELLCRQPELDVEVMYWDLNTSGYFDRSFGREVVWDVDLVSKYPHWSPTERSPIRRAVESVRRLSARRPEVILCFGWAAPIARLAIAWAEIYRIPILLYGDSTWQHSSRPRLRALRSLVLRQLFSRPRNGALATGVFNRDFYLIHGMRRENVHRGVCPVDTEQFSRAAEDRAKRSSSAPSPPAVSIAFAGKFIDRKAPGDLLDAAALLPKSPPWHVTMIGAGPLRGALEDRVVELNLGDRVTFSGFKNASEMPAMLASADILVVPSIRDMRVLVTTEAMAAGAVPVVSSATAIWGAGDLVEHGVTGFVYPVGDSRVLTDVLRRIIADRELRSRLSKAARVRALEHDADHFAGQAAAAVRAASSLATAPSKNLLTAVKIQVGRAITHRSVGRAVGALFGSTIRVAGARIAIGSPRVLDSTRALLAFGLYESAEIRFVRRYLRTDLDVVELGSSIGVVGSIILSKLDANRRLLAVEADSELAAIAAENFAANAGGTTWQLHVGAIAYGGDTRVKFLPSADPIGGKLAPDDDDGLFVDRLTLADVLTIHDVEHYALVADIEGAEAGFISEDASALRNCEQMIIELHDTDQMSIADLRAALIEVHGFSVTAEHGPVLVLAR